MCDSDPMRGGNDHDARSLVCMIAKLNTCKEGIFEGV